MQHLVGPSASVSSSFFFLDLHQLPLPLHHLVYRIPGFLILVTHITLYDPSLLTNAYHSSTFPNIIIASGELAEITKQGTIMPVIDPTCRLTLSLV